MTHSDPAHSPSALSSPRRRIRWPRILLWSFCSLLALALLSAGGFVLWLRSVTRAALPVLDGDLHLTGLSAPVTVRRDAHGVPHIEAANESDLFFAQGYVTAQDRLWQMDVSRRYANGEMAEIVGPSQLMHDKTQRVLLIRLTAWRIYNNLPASERSRLDAYARGVSLYIAQHQNTLPAEFRLLRYRPAPWSGADTLSIGLSMVQSLDSRFETKLNRERIAAKLNNEKLEADLYPVGSWRDHPPTGVQLDLSQPHPEPPSTSGDEDDNDDDRSQTKAEPPMFIPLAEDALLRHGPKGCDGCAPGSNNWVVAGRHTASGKPLLSNDMHLPLTAPGVWHMVDLAAPGIHVAGVTLPGVPGVIAGHNEHIAWGFTALYADVQDLYYEELDGKGNFQDIDTAWKPLGVDHEIIHVRGGKDVALEVQSTAHGPLLNPILPGETRPVALKWTIYDPALNSLPIFQLDTASNWGEFAAALNNWCWPTQSVVYADDQGHIAYHAVGRVPIRWGGMGVFNKPLPHDRLDLRFEWGLPLQGQPLYIPFDSMPGVFDPPSGFLATANSRVTVDKPLYPISHDASAIPLSNDWVDPYRIERIYKQLQGRDQLTPADMLALQTDVYSEVDQELGHRFAYAIDHIDNADTQLRQAADLMRAWDGRLTADSAAASIVVKTRAALWPMLLEPKLGKDAALYSWGEKNFAQEELIMRGNPAWLPMGYKNWDALLAAAVRKAIDEGKAPANLARWSYGSWHVVDIEHPLARMLPLIGPLAGTGEQPLSGDTTTVKQVGRAFGPSQRFTMDWSNTDGSTENIPLGESGNPLSPYYRDQWNAYYSGTTFPLPFTPAAVAAQTRHTLRLLP